MIIKLARVKKGFTIEELAQELKINKNTLMKYEKGDYGNIKLKTFKKMIRVLEVDQSELLDHVEED
jgi:transcriptional regulator with XRE-family HTH domain